MNKICEYYKSGFGKYKCSRNNEEIDPRNCKNCNDRDYPQVKKKEPIKVYKPLNKRTSKLNKLERNRFTILDLKKEQCSECHRYIKTSTNEIFCGRNRKNSMIHGAINYLCIECHKIYDIDMELRLKWQRRFKKKFLENHTETDFINIFGRSYK